jgi:hypothetical protein
MQKPPIDLILDVMKTNKYPVFESRGIFEYNLNLLGIRSTDVDSSIFNDLLCIFYQSIKGQWSVDYFTITTDPSDLILRKPENPKGTAILCEGHHSRLWSYGYHKGRKDHKALVQFSPCRVYRDNDKDDDVDTNTPIDIGMFGINMHRASAYTVNPKIGLYSAGCQVHYDVNRYNTVFIPLIENCVREGNRIFSYTLCLQQLFGNL